MGYENFKNSDLMLVKIVENAKKFGVDALQNELLISQFLNAPQIKIEASERKSIEEIFTKLLQIEQDVQLSK